MLEWMIVLGLILFGLSLIVIEIIFIPGTTVIGILGFIFGVAGLVLCFDYFGTTTGTICSIVTFVVSIGIIVYSLKSGVWERFSLKTANNAKVNAELGVKITVGMQGKTISALRPIGNALFDEKVVEVRTKGDYLPANSAVQVIQILDHKIIVESI